MVDPEHSLITLMCKWIISVCESGNSNFKFLLRYRLMPCQPRNGDPWPSSLEWFTKDNFKAHVGSKIWGRVMPSWKSLVGDLQTQPPTNKEEWMNSSIWHTEEFEAICPRFSKHRAAQLAHAGLSCVSHGWNEDTQSFISGQEANEKFGLLPIEFNSWNILSSNMTRSGHQLITQWSPTLKPGDWIGFYDTEADPLPTLVLQGSNGRNFIMNGELQESSLSIHIPIFSVLPNSSTLIELHNSSFDLNQPPVETSESQMRLIQRHS